MGTDDYQYPDDVGRGRNLRLGRFSERVFFYTVFPALCIDLYDLQNLRHDLFRLVSAVPFPFLPVLLPRGGACVQWQKIWVQPEKPASEAAGDLSGGLCGGSLDLHPVPNVKGTLNK